MSEKFLSRRSFVKASAGLAAALSLPWFTSCAEGGEKEEGRKEAKAVKSSKNAEPMSIPVKNPADSNAITRDYFDSLLLETRYMDTCLPSTELKLFGKTFDTPIMTAALSHLGNTAEDGMRTYAKAAAACNAVHWVGMGEEDELEQIIATGAQTIKIIKPYENNADILHRIEHAVKAGCIAVGMDIDHALNGSGGYDTVLGYPMNVKSTKEIASFAKAAGIPYIIKGVLSVHDALKCVEAGVAGIVISHHRGMMPYSVAPLMVIEDIVKAVNGRMKIFVDCGISSGMDAYKCLALGADAVSVGTHLMPLLKDGPDAVAKRINQMTAELAGVMARTGVASLDKMDPTVIHKSPLRIG